MKQFWKSIVAGCIALATLGAGAAWADRPDPCRYDHDHRSHAADYYNYYPADKYFRSGVYRNSGVSLSITVGDDGYDRRGYRDDDYGRRGYRDDDDGRRGYRDDDYGRRNGYRGRDGRVVNREVYDTRYRARIVLTEEIVRTRHGPRLLCTVDARGPQARYVPNKRLRQIARNECSRRAEVRIVT
jgi:hypothetical protein